MTVLITGAGLIGTHAARSILDQGAKVLLYDPEPSPSYIESVVGKDRPLCLVERGDVRDLARMVDLIRRLGVTRVLHTGGLVGPRVDENPYMAFQTNVLGTLNVIEAARMHGLSRVVFVSSNYVYLDPEPPQGEGPISETTPHAAPGTFYGAYKAMAELLTLAYQRLANTNAIIVRPCAVYGRGGYVGGAQHGRTLNDLLWRALFESAGAPLTVDLPTAERVYVKDAAYALREAVFVEKPQSRIYNVGSGEIVTPRMLADAINAAVPGARAVTEASPSNVVRPLDLSLAREDLKYEPQWPLARAIPDYLEELRAYGRYASG